MKAFIRNGGTFIAVSPRPTQNMKGGLTISLADSQHSTDIIAGKIQYDIPEHLQGKVLEVFIKE